MEWFEVTREQMTAVLEFAARHLDGPAPPRSSPVDARSVRPRQPPDLTFWSQRINECAISKAYLWASRPYEGAHLLTHLAAAARADRLRDSLFEHSRTPGGACQFRTIGKRLQSRDYSRKTATHDSESEPRLGWCGCLDTPRMNWPSHTCRGFQATVPSPLSGHPCRVRQSQSPCSVAGYQYID